MDYNKLTVQDLEQFATEVEEKLAKKSSFKLGIETLHTGWGTIYRIHLGNGGFVDTGEAGLKEFDKAIKANLHI